MRKSITFSAFLFFFSAALAESQGCRDGNIAFISGNYAKTVSILEPLAAQGDACAQNRLADLYKFGKGVPVDNKKALGLYEAAAAQGNNEAKLQAELLKSAKK